MNKEKEALALRLNAELQETLGLPDTPHKKEKQAGLLREIAEVTSELAGRARPRRSAIDRALNPDPISRRTWAIIAWVAGMWAVIRLSNDFLTMGLLAIVWTGILGYLNPYHGED